MDIQIIDAYRAMHDRAVESLLEKGWTIIPLSERPAPGRMWKNPPRPPCPSRIRVPGAFDPEDGTPVYQAAGGPIEWEFTLEEALHSAGLPQLPRII
jgi:hypothetical protein